MSTKIPVPPLGADATRGEEFQVFSAPSLVRFLSRGVQPPSQIYLKHTDTLQVQCASSQAGESVTFNYRLLRADGALVKGQFIIPVPATRAVVTQNEPMAEGFLLSLSCKAAVATTRGQTFARAFLTSGALGPNQPSYTLMADYVTTQFAPAHPNGRLLAPSEGPGRIITYVVALPGAGNDWNTTVPVNARWRVVACTATLQTGAAVANRQPGIQLSVGGHIAFQSITNVNLPASQTSHIYYAPIEVLSVNPNVSLFVPLPPGLVMLGNDQLLSTTTNLNAGDIFTYIAVSVEEWLDNV